MDSVQYADGRLVSWRWAAVTSHIASLPLPDAEFVFISACQRASGSDVLPDETMHVAAAMHVAV